MRCSRIVEKGLRWLHDTEQARLSNPIHDPADYPDWAPLKDEVELRLARAYVTSFSSGEAHFSFPYEETARIVAQSLAMYLNDMESKVLPDGAAEMILAAPRGSCSVIKNAIWTMPRWNLVLLASLVRHWNRVAVLFGANGEQTEFLALRTARLICSVPEAGIVTTIGPAVQLMIESVETFFPESRISEMQASLSMMSGLIQQCAVCAQRLSTPSIEHHQRPLLKKSIASANEDGDAETCQHESTPWRDVLCEAKTRAAALMTTITRNAWAEVPEEIQQNDGKDLDIKKVRSRAYRLSDTLANLSSRIPVTPNTKVE